jgi:hypothetical protein
MAGKARPHFKGSNFSEKILYISIQIAYYAHRLLGAPVPTKEELTLTLAAAISRRYLF